MSVVYKPERKHHCSPGWTWRASTGEGIGAVPKGMRYGIPPTPWDYPKGTVWQCECGQTWVSQGSPAAGRPGWCTFRREGRFERRRRERRSQRTEMRETPWPPA